MPDGPIVLFDGVCNLCNWSVRFIIRHDQKAHFRFAALQSDTGRRLLEPRGLCSDPPQSMVLIEGDCCYTQSDAVLRIAKHLGGLWRILAVGYVIPRPLRNRLYALIAGKRYKWFGKKDSCMVPTGETASRFLQ